MFLFMGVSECTVVAIEVTVMSFPVAQFLLQTRIIFAFFLVCLEISKLFLMLYLTLKSQRFMLKDKSLLLIMVFV